MNKLYKRLSVICLFFIIYYTIFIRFDLYDFFGVRVKYFNEIENTYIMDETGYRATKYNPYPTIKYINCLSDDKTYSVILEIQRYLGLMSEIWLELKGIKIQNG